MSNCAAHRVGTGHARSRAHVASSTYCATIAGSEAGSSSGDVNDPVAPARHPTLYVAAFACLPMLEQLGAGR